jgi:hypothetical protein
MLDVHAPNQSVHTLKDFLIHIAAITIGLLIALGLEATVEWAHHKHQAQQALELLKQEVDRNRVVLENDMRSGDLGERNHRAALAVLQRLRLGTRSPDDRLIFVRKFDPFGSTAWNVAHESGAAAYIPYELMARYGDVYEAQQLNQRCCDVRLRRVAECYVGAQYRGGRSKRQGGRRVFNARRKVPMRRRCSYVRRTHDPKPRRVKSTRA